MELKCKVCHKICSDVESFVKHFDLSHKVGPHSHFLCGVDSCSLNFKTLNRYERHFKDFHEIQTSAEVFKCALCPYSCTVKSTLRVHRKRNHSGQAISCDNGSNLSKNSSSADKNDEGCEGSITFESDDLDIVQTEAQEQCERDVPTEAPEECKRDVLRKKMLHFYLTLSSRFHIPESTIQFLVDSVHTYATESDGIVKEDLLNSMVKAGIDHNKACDILNSAFEDDVFVEVHSSNGPLRSRYMRRKNFISNFKFVEPKPKKLGLNDNNEVRQCHTVSIKKTIQSLLEDDAIYEQYLESHNYVPSSEYYKDIYDGSLLSTHPVLSKDPTAIGVLFYEDDLELVNSLGSAKGVHKITAVEYTLSFLKPWCRMKKDGLQVALLCAEKDVAYFGLSTVLAPLMKKLKKLEEVGLEIRGKTVKVVPVMLLGDNLGTHTFTGFVENFSKSSYFCRHCEESRAEWRKRWYATETIGEEEESDASDTDDSSDESDEEGGDNQNLDFEDLAMDVEVEDVELPEKPYSTAPLRTPQSYDECLKKVKASPSLGHVKGIVGECEFNKLNNFHCTGASPPCLAHDIFEGVLAHDVPLILKDLMAKFNITEDYINRRIKSVKLLGTDRNDRPAKITEKMKKLRGNAIQNWNFLRFLPLYIGGKITDKTYKVWKMLLLLIQVTRILCSPCLLKDSPRIIRLKVHKYLTMRVLFFPHVPIRPKHHFWEHFDYLLTVYGNLMRVSTLAFESKHRFYKDTAAKKKNFKNITKTLTMEHQLAMSALSVDSLVSNYPIVVNGLPLQSIILPDDISACVSSFFGPEFLMTAAFSEKVTYHGTLYSKGTAVVTYSGTPKKLEMCFIETLIVKGTDCYAAGWLSHASLIPSYQLYRFSQSSKCIVVNMGLICDYISYPVYSFNNHCFVMLKHMPFSFN